MKLATPGGSNNPCELIFLLLGTFILSSFSRILFSRDKLGMTKRCTEAYEHVHI